MTKLDNNLRPQDDFFGYINNSWIKANPIPPSESVWGTFYELRNKSSMAIKEIVDDLLQKQDKLLDHDQKLIKQFFLSAINFDKNQSNQIETLHDELSKIDQITNVKQLSYYLGTAHRKGFSPFWEIYIAIDDKNSQTQVMRFHQSGLGLPNRDYYLDKNPRMTNIRKKYKIFFESILNALSLDKTINWQNVIDIENKLAKASWTNVKLRDINGNYNHFTLNELLTKFSKIDWLEYFKGYNWKKPSDDIVFGQLPFMEEVQKIISSHDINAIKDYLRWQVINDLIDWTNDNTAKINFEFYQKTINGKIEDNPTWKRAFLQAEDLIIGEVLGKEYVAKHFPESSKQAVLELVKDVKNAYHKRIDKVTWMKEETKAKAHRKLDNTRTLIGYPSEWHNFDKLNLVDDNHLANTLALFEFKSDIETAKIGKKPDYENWLMNAHTVNAYYDPSQLITCFPAAILQPPFYDPNASYASNLGGIGSVIGHEFTHGFDDQGAEYDEFGDAKKWITPSESKQFINYAKGIVKQANNYEILPGIKLKGKLILGEAIADIGGIELAIEALRATNTDNFLNDVRELLENYAKSERGSSREEHTIRQVKTDPHPPSIFRVNCTMMHINDFYDAYNVTPGDKLYLPIEDRVQIW